MQYDDQIQQQMFSMILSWQQSGLSQKIYCEQHQIRYHVFHYWYRRYKDTQTPKTELGFVPLRTEPSASLSACSANIEMVLADGKRILFHQPVSSDYLKALIS